MAASAYFTVPAASAGTVPVMRYPGAVDADTITGARCAEPAPPARHAMQASCPAACSWRGRNLCAWLVRCAGQDRDLATGFGPTFWMRGLGITE